MSSSCLGLTSPQTLTRTLSSRSGWLSHVASTPREETYQRVMLQECMDGRSATLITRGRSIRCSWWSPDGSPRRG
ncbi:hypothetical protein CMUS01_14461 [Colletotrichum musicola]|uniref:Uncharacterized protein n=1 Tax=Colletotrichum musicola TaxID=2175873 RepID=A0A8H6MRX6_9PEZI|nr:hypothetical protein CMUS01_14461 [Colletotrichum musicola]